MVGSAKRRSGVNTGVKTNARGFPENVREANLASVCGHADERRRDASDLMGYNYEGSYVWISQIGVRDITFYDRSVPAHELGILPVQPLSPFLLNS